MVSLKLKYLINKILTLPLNQAELRDGKPQTLTDFNF